MKKTITDYTIIIAAWASIMLLAFAFSGCSSVNIQQHEVMIDGTVRDSTVRQHSFMDGKSEINNTKTTMTDKTQGIGIGKMAQDSNGSNAVQVLRIVVEGAVSGAAKAIIP